MDCIDAQIWTLKAAGGRATKGVIDEVSPLSRLILLRGLWVILLSSSWLASVVYFFLFIASNSEVIAFLDTETS